MITFYEFDVTLCGINIAVSDFIVTLCELAITLCTFVNTLCGFVIYLCWFNITLFNLFSVFCAFPNTFKVWTFYFVMSLWLTDAVYLGKARLFTLCEF